MPVFVIIPILSDKLQDGLLNVAGVSILLLKVPSVDTPFPLYLDSRGSDKRCVAWPRLCRGLGFGFC